MTVDGKHLEQRERGNPDCGGAEILSVSADRLHGAPIIPMIRLAIWYLVL